MLCVCVCFASCVDVVKLHQRGAATSKRISSKPPRGTTAAQSSGKEPISTLEIYDIFSFVSSLNGALTYVYVFSHSYVTIFFSLLLHHNSVSVQVFMHEFIIDQSFATSCWSCCCCYSSHLHICGLHIISSADICYATYSPFALLRQWERVKNTDADDARCARGYVVHLGSAQSQTTRRRKTTIATRRFRVLRRARRVEFITLLRLASWWFVLRCV